MLTQLLCHIFTYFVFTKGKGCSYDLLLRSVKPVCLFIFHQLKGAQKKTETNTEKSKSGIFRFVRFRGFSEMFSGFSDFPFSGIFGDFQLLGIFRFREFSVFRDVRFCLFLSKVVLSAGP